MMNDLLEGEPPRLLHFHKKRKVNFIIAILSVFCLGGPELSRRPSRR